jgi:microcystin-dependent protein
MPAEPFLAEVYIAGFNFAPTGFALCNGAIMPITQNTALFSLLGTTFGGDGVSTFALPDLRGRVAVGAGQGPGLQNYLLGTTGGQESVALTVSQIPSHGHLLEASPNPASDRAPQNNVLAMPRDPAYAPGTPSVPLGLCVATTGGNQAHENRQPYLVMTAYIALQGVFPSRS